MAAPHRSFLSSFHKSDDPVPLTSQLWDVRMPPVKKRMIQGHLLPAMKGTAFRFVTKKRKVTIEVHGILGTSPIDDTFMNRLIQGKLKQDMKLDEKDLVIIRIMKEKDDKDYNDEESIMTNANDNATVSSLGGGTIIDDSHVEHARYRLEEIEILRVYKKICEVKVGHGSDTVVRDLKFKSEGSVKRFQTLFEKLKEMEKLRSLKQAEKYLTSRPTTNSTEAKVKTRDLFNAEAGQPEMINILAEIVSAKELPAADLLSSDPYVIVRMGGQEIHRTEVISKTLNPIWTLKTGSLFLIRKTPQEFFAATGGCNFQLKDYDAVGSNEVLGAVSVPLEEILEGKGERKEYIIRPEKSTEKKAGKLYLRFKQATDDEIEFMERFKANPKEKGLFIQETYLGPGVHKGSMLDLGMKRQVKRGVEKQELHRAKPFPDPTRPQYETEWMTVKDLRKEAMKPSTQWIEAGSGELGKLYVEVIGCDDLPNMDSMTLNPTDKTDAFACLLFEDSAVNTDVINDELSPRWMPWSRRAFVFNVSHLSSSLFVGIFDHDSEMSPTQMISRTTGGLHDPIARTVAAVSQCVPGTVYTVSYTLYAGGQKPKERKKTHGKLILRVRLEVNSITMAMAKSVIPPQMSFVSSSRAIDFELIHYTAEGAHEFNKWSMETFTKHIEELQSYEVLIDYILDGLLTVWLWRGHFPIHLCGKKICVLPLHSVIAFAWAILISWDFNMFFSFLLFSVGWILLGTNEYMARNPAPWHQVSGYWRIFTRFVLNTSIPTVVPSNHHLKEYEAYLKAEEERLALKKKRKELEAKFVSVIEDEYADDMAQASQEVNEDLTTKQGPLKGIGLQSVNPLKPILYPIQLELGKIVLLLRAIKNIILWRQSYYAFWITTASFLGSLAICWLPWGWMIRWVFRIAAIGLLGPWMMIVDYMFFREKPNLTPEQREAEMVESIRARYAYLEEASKTRQLQKERRKKLKAMKQYLYGGYIQKVPHFIEDSFIDYPLIESFCEKYDVAKHGKVEIVDRKYGQMLTGDMIPKREIQASHTSKAPKKKKGVLGKIGKKMNPARLFRRSDEKQPLLGESTGTYETIEEVKVVGLV